jgi:hypothetical protein
MAKAASKPTPTPSPGPAPTPTPPTQYFGTPLATPSPTPGPQPKPKPKPAVNMSSDVGGAGSGYTEAKDTGIKVPLNYRWNLPPHVWSLPLRPETLYAGEFTAAPRNGVFSTNVGAHSVKTYSSYHGMRRGRMWFYNGGGAINKVTDTGEVTTVGSAIAGGNVKDAQGNTVTASVAVKGAQELSTDNKNGFQFLWNPESFNISVERNMDITPSSADRFRAVAGAFPGQETLSFTIILDRTNDFIAIKGLYKDKPYLLSSIASMYTGNDYPGAYAENFDTKIKELMRLGTGHDIEYLFRMINGRGLGDGSTFKEWQNLLGKKTADTGYLQPNLVAIQLGPDLDSLSYVGWVSNLNITHEKWTQMMIPLKTTVTFSMACFTGMALSN